MYCERAIGSAEGETMGRAGYWLVSIVAVGGSLVWNGPTARGQIPSAPAGRKAMPDRPATTVVLLKNGNALIGQVVRRGDRIVVTDARGTQIRLGSERIEGLFGSVAEALAYRRQNLGRANPDRLLSLAYWALRNGDRDGARRLVDEVERRWGTSGKLAVLRRRIAQVDAASEAYRTRDGHVNDRPMRTLRTARTPSGSAGSGHPVAAQAGVRPRREVVLATASSDPPSRDPYDPERFNRRVHGRR